MAFQFGYALPCGRIVNSCCPFWRGIGIDINLPAMQDFTLPKIYPLTNELCPEPVLPVSIPMLNLLNAGCPRGWADRTCSLTLTLLEDVLGSQVEEGVICGIRKNGIDKMIFNVILELVFSQTEG